MKKSQSLVSLKFVTDSDTKYLFDLLKERDSNTNISHKKMPTYNEHTKFIKSKPYSRWYIIILEKEKIGSIYLSKHDEIGIFLKKRWERNDIRLDSLKKLMKRNPRRRYLANVNPKNKKLISFWKENDFHLVSFSYELEK